MASSEQTHFGIRVAAQVSELKPAMVDYLCRSGLLVPSGRRSPGRGRARLYTFADLVILRALAHLLQAGISVAKLRKALKVLQERHPKATSGSQPERFLVTDGVRVYYRSARDLLQELTSGQLVFRFVIEMARVRQHVSERIGSRQVRSKSGSVHRRAVR